MEYPLRSRLITSLYSAFICSSVFTEPTLRPSFPPFSIYRFLPDCNRNEILSRSNCAQVESVAIIIGAKRDNTVRLKPKEGMHEDGEVLAIVTIVTERYRTQYALLYTTRLQEAVTDKEIQQIEKNAYNNPAVTLSSTDMARYARQIWSSEAHVNNVKTKAHKMAMRLNNIYSSGDYFFLDFSVENKTHIPFDIDQIRLKLTDKKTAKATNSQMVELHPVFTLEQTKRFRYGYRNVIVIRKMTFPNDKQLTIEMTENQISGRTISLKVNYSDVLSADSFNPIFLK